MVGCSVFIVLFVFIVVEADIFPNTTNKFAEERMRPFNELLACRAHYQQENPSEKNWDVHRRSNSVYMGKDRKKMDCSKFQNTEKRFKYSQECWFNHLNCLHMELRVKYTEKDPLPPVLEDDRNGKKLCAALAEIPVENPVEAAYEKAFGEIKDWCAPFIRVSQRPVILNLKKTIPRFANTEDCEKVFSPDNRELGQQNVCLLLNAVPGIGDDFCRIHSATYENEEARMKASYSAFNRVCDQGGHIDVPEEKFRDVWGPIKLTNDMAGRVFWCLPQLRTTD